MDANKDYNKIKSIFAELTSRESQLESELNLIEEDQKKQFKQLATIEAQTERQLESINIAKREESIINEDELHKKCKDAIDYFLQDISSSKAKAGFCLPIRIEYQQMKIFKNIIDENITFEKLKEETKNQFGKEGDEFFFADINGSIYLDGLRVTPALFPLSNVKVDKYEPVVYVLDKTPLKPKKDNNEIKESIDNLNNNSNEEDNDQSFEFYHHCLHILKGNSLRHIFIMILILFIGLYSQNCLEYRQADVYRNLDLTLQPLAADFMAAFALVKDPETNNLLEKNAMEEFMSTLRKKLQLFYDFTGNNSNVALHKALIPLKYLRLIQKRSLLNIGCISDRINEKTIEACDNTFEYNKEPFILNEVTYEYVNQRSYQKIKGRYNNYDNSGHILDIPINDPPAAKAIIEWKSKWIDKSTSSIILLLNFYNIHTDTIVILRFLFEHRNNNVISTYNLQFLNLSTTVNGYLIVCILLSFILIILLFFMIKSHPNNNNSVSKSYFKCPSPLELFSLLNILFFYVMLIFRFSFLAHYTDTPIGSLNLYEDFQDSEMKYQQVAEASCFNLIFFYMILIGMLRDYLDEFQTITNAIGVFFKKLYPYALLFILPFLLVSMLMSYELFGDYIKLMYRDLTFVFLKVLQSFFRGSLDHIDYDNKDHIFSSDGVQHSYWNILDHSGCTGYIAYALMYFVVGIVMIKGFIIANYLIEYREGYIIKMGITERLKREEMLLEKNKGRMEEKKRLLEKEKEKDLLIRKDTEEGNILMAR